MPYWGQLINMINPIAHFTEILKYIILKGTTIHDLKFYLIGFIAFAVIINTITILFTKILFNKHFLPINFIKIDIKEYKINMKFLFKLS